MDDNPLPWLPEPAWQAVASLGELEEFSKFSSDLVEAGPRFREWFNHITPETEKLPLDWCARCIVQLPSHLLVLNIVNDSAEALFFQLDSIVTLERTADTGKTSRFCHSQAFNLFSG